MNFLNSNRRMSFSLIWFGEVGFIIWTDLYVPANRTMTVWMLNLGEFPICGRILWNGVGALGWYFMVKYYLGSVHFGRFLVEADRLVWWVSGFCWIVIAVCNWRKLLELYWSNFPKESVLGWIASLLVFIVCLIWKVSPGWGHCSLRTILLCALNCCLPKGQE